MVSTSHPHNFGEKKNGKSRNLRGRSGSRLGSWKSHLQIVRQVPEKWPSLTRSSWKVAPLPPMKPMMVTLPDPVMAMWPWRFDEPKENTWGFPGKGWGRERGEMWGTHVQLRFFVFFAAFFCYMLFLWEKQRIFEIALKWKQPVCTDYLHCNIEWTHFCWHFRSVYSLPVMEMFCVFL